MSSNDGKQLLVFGLSFAQHDNRKMQQLLRHYDKLPDNPGSRANLFVQLNKVAKELMADEAAQDQIRQLTDWMTKGGDFPLGTPQPLTPANSGGQTSSAQGTHNVPLQAFHRGLLPLGSRQGYYGPGRTLSGQPSTADQPNRQVATTQPPRANLGRQYGRGRTMDGEWEQGDEEEGEEDHDGEDNNEEGMHPDFDEDEEMDDHMGGFPGIPEGHQGRFGGFQRGATFSGPGRTLNDPPEEPSEGTAEGAGGAAGSMDIDDLITDISQRQPGGLEFPPLGAAGGSGVGHHLEPHHNQDDLPTRFPGSLQEYEAPKFEDEYPEQDDGQEIECPICLEEYPRSKFPKHATITRLCDHPDKACLNCIDSSITAIIERGALHLLACPICPQRLSDWNIKEYASPAVYKRYKYLKEQSEIPGHYISCTNPACGGSQAHESEDPMMICNCCQFATCAKHRRPWHEGQTCKEFDLDDAQIERLEEEEATAKLLSGEAMSICPKCGQGVTKSDGCDHMQCKCGQEWCYVCSCSYDNILRLGPTAHATFCTYHPNKVNLSQSQKEAARNRIMGLVHGGEVSAELARAREDLRRRRREEIRPKAAEAAEARMRLQQEQNKDQEAAQGADSQPQKKKRKVKLVAPWEEGGWTKKAL